MKKNEKTDKVARQLINSCLHVDIHKNVRINCSQFTRENSNGEI